MNRIVARFAVVVFALTVSIGAFAATKSTDIYLYNPAQLNGTTIPAGHYTLKCDTTGSTAQVKVMKGKKEIATATGQVKTLSTKSDQTALVLQNGGQIPSINEIRFSNSSTAVEFGSGMSSGTSGQ